MLPPEPVVVLLGGPSGAGKSRLADRLARRHGWCVVRLDDFYRDGDEPGLPRCSDLDAVDWDDPRSWNAEDAIAALEELVRTGRARVPSYDISASRRTGTRTVATAPGAPVLAEGIFVAELVGPLRERGLLASAWCVTRPRALTALLRLVRDLREARKPPLLLLRRGLALQRVEPRVVDRLVQAGATPASPGRVAAALEAAHGR